MGVQIFGQEIAQRQLWGLQWDSPALAIIAGEISFPESLLEQITSETSPIGIAIREKSNQDATCSFFKIGWVPGLVWKAIGVGSRR